LRKGLALVVLAVVAGALGACGGAVGPEGTGAGSLPFDGRSPVAPQGARVRVLVELRRPSLAEQVASQPYGPGRQRSYVSSLHDEVNALQSALRAKGVELRRPVLYGRVWNGFAATVDARDLPELRALGLRAEPVRRFYGAVVSGPSGATGPEAESRKQKAAGGAGAPEVALLDSGVDSRSSGGRVRSGYDAVGGDEDPRPAGARERHGTTLARLLVDQLGADGRVLSIRVAGLQPDQQTGGRLEFGTTDQVLQGLERAVDPNGDGDTSDHVAVALVGVNSPYAGFSQSPEATGAAAARSLGTLVVAPAGNEGGGRAPFGTVGSPAAAPGVLAVGALEGGGAPALPSVKLGLATGEGRALLRGTLLGGRAGRPLRAPVSALSGPSQADPRQRGRALGGSPLDYFGVDATPRARRHVVVVAARGASGSAPSLAARAAAASEAGASALVVCEPDAGRSLSALPDGSSDMPVIGLRGKAARRALDLTPRDGGLAFVSAPEMRTTSGPRRPAQSSSRGPTYALASKPDIAAPGTAILRSGAPTLRNGTAPDEVVAGTSVASARVAAAAARLHASRPESTPDDLAAALTGTARDVGSPLSAGAGELDLARALKAPVLIEPFTIAFPRQPDGKAFSLERPVTVRNTGAATLQLKLAAKVAGLDARVTPATVSLAPNASRKVTVRVAATGSGPRPGYLAGRLSATGAGGTVSTVIALPVGPPPPARLGALTLTSRRGATDGVRFTAGALRVAAGARSVEPLGNLRLRLVDAGGKVERELTPPGGATDLLPGEYAYTLTKSARKGLPPGSYRFTARGRGPAGGPPVVRSSPTFEVR
jgi:hypothetical protein